MMLWECPKELASTYWPKAKAAVETALDRQALGVIEVTEHNVLNGHWSLWFAYDDPTAGWIGVGVAYIAREVLNVVAWTGALEQTLLVPMMVQAMKGRAKAIRFIGPRAWGRVLPGEWRDIAVVWELRL